MDTWAVSRGDDCGLDYISRFFVRDFYDRIAQDTHMMTDMGERYFIVRENRFFPSNAVNGINQSNISITK